MKTSYRITSSLVKLIRVTILPTAILATMVVANKLKAQTPISFGTTKIDQKLVASQNTVYSFSGTVGQLVTIQMTRVSGYFTPIFDILSPTGTTLRTVSETPGTGTARLALFALPVSGTFLMICRDVSGAGAGGYNLTIIDCLGQNPSDTDKGEVVSGQIKAGTLVASDLDAFSFSALAGQLVTIQMTRVSGYFTPTFDFLSPTGTVLKTVSETPGTGTARLALFALPVSGTFPIICRDESGAGAGGYNLSLTILKVDDSDTDGLPDSWELNYFSDLRYSPDDDPDDDDLMNKEELTKKTDPNKADTDGDGFADGTEVAFGSDPLDPNSKPSSDLRIIVRTVDIEFVTISGNRYQLQGSRDLKNWIDFGNPIQGNNSIFRTNIDVRGSGYMFFIAPATVTP